MKNLYLHNMVKNLIKRLIAPFLKLKRRWVLARAYTLTKKAYEEQLQSRKQLKSKINIWLREYFGINANSKYIPKDFKNKEEVKEAVYVRFGDELEKLNLKFEDLFA